MLNKIISWVSGAGKIWPAIQKFLQGKKTYALGTITIVQGCVGIWSDLAGLATSEAFVGYVRAFADNPDWKMILAGLAMFAIKSAIKKAEPKTETDLGGE